MWFQIPPVRIEREMKIVRIFPEEDQFFQERGGIFGPEYETVHSRGRQVHLPYLAGVEGVSD